MSAVVGFLSLALDWSSHASLLLGLKLRRAVRLCVAIAYSLHRGGQERGAEGRGRGGEREEEEETLLALPDRALVEGLFSKGSVRQPFCSSYGIWSGGAGADKVLTGNRRLNKGLQFCLSEPTRTLARHIFALQ